MKNFIAYINAISKNPYVPKDAKHSTAILLPEIDTTEGIYRSLLPSYLLNNEPDHRVIIMGLSEKTNVSNNNKDFEIPAKLIKECNHIIFPFVSFPLQPIIAEIRAVKKDMNFSYYIDFNYYQAPDTYPHASEYKLAKMEEIIETNIKSVNQVIVTNKALKDYIADKLREKYKEKFNTNIIWQPLFVLPDVMQTEYENKPEKGIVKILLIGDEYHFSDINFIKGILKDLKNKYKNKLHIHIIGFDGKRGDKNFLQGLEFEYHERVPYFKYFELIKHIGPDLLLIPASKNSFNNTSKNYIKYLELAYLNIPVIAPLLRPYQDLVSTNENGFLCAEKEDYFMQVDSYFTDKAKFDSVLGPAYATAADYNIAIDGNVEILKNIYFPQYGQK